MRFQKFQNIFEIKVTNRELWEKLLKVLNKVEIDKVDIEQICKELNIKVDNVLVNTKGNIKLDNNELIIATDKTNSTKVNRFTIAHELGHAILHYEELEKV